MIPAMDLRRLLGGAVSGIIAVKHRRIGCVWVVTRRLGSRAVSRSSGTTYHVRAQLTFWTVNMLQALNTDVDEGFFDFPGNYTETSATFVGLPTVGVVLTLHALAVDTIRLVGRAVGVGVTIGLRCNPGGGTKPAAAKEECCGEDQKNGAHGQSEWSVVGWDGH